MKKKLLITMCLSVSTLIFLLSAPSYAGIKDGVTNDLAKIGVMVDMTGPTSNVGVLMALAFRNLVSDINDRGGIHGRKISLVIEDNRYSIPLHISAFKKLVFKDNVFAIMGPVSVGGSRVLFKDIQKNQIPTLPWTPDDSLKVPYKRYVLPVNGFYDTEVGVIFDHIVNTLKPKNLKLAFLTFDVESGMRMKELVKKWADVFGITDIDYEVIPMAVIDVTSQVLTMQRARATHLYIHHVAPGVSATLKDMKRFGFVIPTFGSSAACTEDTMRIAGEASKNFIGATSYSSWHEDYPGMKRVRNISMKYNPGAKASYPNRSYLYGWVLAEILFEGMTKAGKDLDREKLVDALETLHDFDTKGLSSPITYTPTMHYGMTKVKLVKTDPPNQRFIPITDWKSERSIK
jgi:branched-chain amino acid transport system substrate-binding protein